MFLNVLTAPVFVLIYSIPCVWTIKRGYNSNNLSDIEFNQRNRISGEIFLKSSSNDVKPINDFYDKPLVAVKYSRNRFHIPDKISRRKNQIFFDILKINRANFNTVNKRTNNRKSVPRTNYEASTELISRRINKRYTGSSFYNEKRSTKQKRRRGRKSKHKNNKHGKFISQQNLKSNRCPELPRSKRTLKPVCTRGRKVGSRCLMKCARGYFPPGIKRYRRCRMKPDEDGNLKPRWTGKDSDFLCVPICDLPKQIEHGGYHCRIIGEDFECTFSCNANYKLWGSEKRRCISGSSWTGDAAYCSIKTPDLESSRKMEVSFELYQNLSCGSVKSMTTFKRDGHTHMVVADYRDNAVRVFIWKNGFFEESPTQEISFFGPIKTEVLTDLNNTTWLLIANSDYMTFYRLMGDGQFYQSHSNDSQLIIPSTTGLLQEKTDAIAFAELHGEVYRCYGRNRREIPFVVVQKLQDIQRIGRRTTFQRIMRKRLPGEFVQQCSMYADRGSIYTVVTLNKFGGNGRILIGEMSNKKRGMKVVTVISSDSLREISDSFGFSSPDGSRYIVAGQASRNGKCTVYKRIWKPVEETIL